jgi:hypothetical protein
MTQCKGDRGRAQVTEGGYNSGVPLSPMYPPREDRGETPAARSEFTLGIATALAYGTIYLFEGWHW